MPVVNVVVRIRLANDPGSEIGINNTQIRQAANM